MVSFRTTEMVERDSQRNGSEPTDGMPFQGTTESAVVSTREHDILSVSSRVTPPHRHNHHHHSYGTPSPSHTPRLASPPRTQHHSSHTCIPDEANRSHLTHPINSLGDSFISPTRSDSPFVPFFTAWPLVQLYTTNHGGRPSTHPMARHRPSTHPLRVQGHYRYHQ